MDETNSIHQATRPTDEAATRMRLQFQNAQIERVTLNGRELEVVFASIPSTLVKDPFGFDFEPHGESRCQITIKNPQYEFLPQPGPVLDGHIALGELCYISLFPPDLALDCPCFLMIEQPSSEVQNEDGVTASSDEEEMASATFLIVGDELKVNTRAMES